MLFRYLTSIALVLVMVAGSGCKPAGKTQQTGQNLPGSGKEIVSVDMTPKAPGPFKDVEIDGAEKLQSRIGGGQPGGTFYEIQLGEGPKTFNNWASYDATSSTLSGMMLSGLLTQDAYTGEFIPYLAKSVKLSDDKMTYTVVLRKGLKWSDGKPLTSKDVVFTWNEIVKKGLGNPSNRDVVTIEGTFPTVKAIDELTIEFKTAKPFSPFMANLTSPIAPAHILAPLAAKGNDAFSKFWSVSDAQANPDKFVGSGMWLLEKYVPRQQAVFKRNPNFFMVDDKGQQLPYLDKYSVSFVPDMNATRLQFEQGRSDVYSVPGTFVSDLRSLTKPSFNMYNLGPTSSTTFMAFNLNTRKGDNGKPLVESKKSVWFNDLNFRRAVSLVINRDDLVTNILKGVGAPLYTAEALSSIYLNKKLSDSLAKDANNIEEAKKLLKESGYTWDKTGALLDKKGNPVRFSLYTNSGNTERESTGVNIKEDLSQLGIKVDFKPMDFNVLIGKFEEGSWETIVMGLTGSQTEPNQGKNVWASNGGLHLFFQRAKGGQPAESVDLKDRLPWEKELDQVFEQGAQVFGEERKPFYNRYQEIISEQMPLIYLYSPLMITAVRTRLQNVDPTPLGGATHNLEEIWIKEDK